MGSLSLKKPFKNQRWRASFSRAVFLTERDLDQTGPSNLPLVFDDDRCLFNTGLYTRRYETIYGLFEPNTKPDNDR